MMDWLTKLANEGPREEDFMIDAINNLPATELKALSNSFGLIENTPHLDDMQVKIADAQRRGRELAHQYGDELEKVAILPALAAALPALAAAGGRMVAGGAAKGAIGEVAKGVVKDQALGAATSAISGGINKLRGAGQQAAPAAAGGFKYAAAGGFASSLGNMAQSATKSLGQSFGKGSPGTLGQKVTGFMVRNPGAALAGAGAVGGALMAPRDPQTGQKQYMRGALTGAALGTGAHMMGGGNALRKAVLNKSNPLMGEGVANYARQATKATGPSARRTAGMSAPSTAGVSAPPQPPPAAPTAGAAAAPARSFAPAQQAAPRMSAAQQAAHEAVGAGIKVPADMLHPDTNLGVGGGVRSQAGMMGDRMVSRPGFFQRAGQYLGGLRSPGSMGGAAAEAGQAAQGFAKAAGDMTKLAEQMFIEMSPAARIQFVAEVMKWEKTANRQTLTYDPATKSFTRQHLTPDTAGGSDLPAIPAGTREAVQSHDRFGAKLDQPVQSGLGPSGGPSQVHSMASGNVLSSSARPGVGPSPQVIARPAPVPPPVPAAAGGRPGFARAATRPGTPPPIPMAARMGGPAGLGAAAAKTKLPSLAGAVSLVKK